MTDNFPGARPDVLFLFQPSGLSRLPADLRPRYRHAPILVRNAALLNRRPPRDSIGSDNDRRDPSSGSATERAG